MNSRVWVGLGVGLLCSGVAGIVNQVIWQRALKVVLGGSESLSSMIVVLVFLAGLGLGAVGVGRMAVRLHNPLRWLAVVEVMLFAINASVALLLGMDLSETVYAVQRIAVGSGVPIRAVYATAAALLLLPPTLLMGSTIPLASEGVQRQLNGTDHRLVPLLFFINTGGAALGAGLASLWWLPWHGQTWSLLAAAGLNALAALALFTLAAAPDVPPSARPSRSPSPVRHEDVLGFGLGVLSLGYEMIVFRALSLLNGPLPETFAAGLCAFLLSWACGMAMARFSAPLTAVTLLVGALTWGMPTTLLTLDVPPDLVTAAGLLGLPVVGFGWLYGQLVSRTVHHWGEDVGRYTALNTIGSCLGVLLFSLLGYAIPQSLTATIIGLGVVLIGALDAAATQQVVREQRFSRAMAGVATLGMLAAGITGWQTPWTEDSTGTRTYWGRDGVVAIQADNDVYIDGLWHTRLVENDDHIGRPYTWVMAVAAVLSHRDAPLERALVIGAGVGVSGVTLAGVADLQVDGYEINHTLKAVLLDYPAQTLGALRHPQLQWIWQDARTGLALNTTRYDIVLSAPLHLRQAGSSLLLSQEYLRLLKSRLKPDGVVAIYSNEGVEAQNLLVQRTVSDAFAHKTTWYDGLVTVASDHPIDLQPQTIAHRLQGQGELFEQMRMWDALERARGQDGLMSLWDGPEPVPEADISITDDWPLLEYPDVATHVVTPR